MPSLSFIWISVEMCFLVLYIIHWYTAWYKRPYVETYIVAYNLNIVFLRFLLWIGLLVELRWVTGSTVLEKGFELQVNC